MPNPLAILGSLATVGSQGLQGGFEGQFEGEQVRRKNESQDIQNQLHVLGKILKQQQITQGQQPHEEIHNGIIYRKNPMTGQMTAVGPAPQAPLNPLQEAQASQARAGAALHGRQAEEVGKPKPHEMTETNLWAGIGQRVAAGTATEIEKGLWDRHQRSLAPHGASHFTTDAAGNVTEIKPDGTKVQHGQVGRPMRPAAGSVPRETVTTSEKITPRKQITKTEDIDRINNSLPALVNEITGQFQARGLNFAVPGAYVKLPSGKMVRKEDVIAQAMKERAGIEVSVRWDQAMKRFMLIKAWDPEQREPTETRRTTGPLRQGEPADDEEK